MTFRLGVLIGLVCGLLLAAAICKRRTAQTAQPVDSDRFNMAELPQRVKQYNAEYNLERSRGK